MIDGKVTNGKRRITVLGSTGSIGQHTLNLVNMAGDAFQIEALTANKNVALLAKQAKEYRAKYAVIADESLYPELKTALADTDIICEAGNDAIVKAAGLKADVVIAGIVGAAGLKPTFAAIQQGTIIGFANKECLVCAGQFMMEAVNLYGATLIPVDSEHSAIFQVFDQQAPEQVDKIILTASGGPFRTYPKEEMANITPEQALKHPNWNMGSKITIDSATMMNKGLELIEAYHLFPVDEHQIDIVVHPESIIHSMVQYCDGSVLAQLGIPDMSTPISYALTYPKRMQVNKPKLDLTQISQLHFEKPDIVKFPALSLARHALSQGSSATIMYNAANEIAVDQFLKGHIRFIDIATIVRESLESRLVSRTSIHSLDDVIAYDKLCRQYTMERAKLFVD